MKIKILVGFILFFGSCNASENSTQKPKNSSNNALPDSLQTLIAQQLNNYQLAVHQYELHLKKTLLTNKEEIFTQEYDSLKNAVLQEDSLMQVVLAKHADSPLRKQYQKIRQDFKHTQTIFEQNFAIE